MDTEPLVKLAVTDSLARITLNRPEAYNALSLELMLDLLKKLEELEFNSAISVIILEGAGKGFCAGHDLKELLAKANMTQRREIFDKCSEVMLKIHALPQPVIAKVHGIATAAGCQLVASCDLAIASLSSQFGTPGVNIGLFCSTPMVALSRAIGQKRAMKMLLDGQLINAKTAEDYGLIHEAVADDDLEDKVMALANMLMSKSRATVKIGKQSFYRQLDMDRALAYDYCGEVMTINMELNDAKEGISAFIDKRHPHWKNS